MACPLCNDTGHIKVILTNIEKKVGIETWRACPMGCVEKVGSGVAGNMSLENYEAEVRKVDDYKKNRGRNRVDWKKHYLGRTE